MLRVKVPFHDAEDFGHVFKEGELVEFGEARMKRVLALGLCEEVEEPKQELKPEPKPEPEPEQEAVEQKAEGPKKAKRKR